MSHVNSHGWNKVLVYLSGLLQGNVPSRDHIHVYYQKAMRLNMSRQSSMDLLSEDDSGSQRVPRRRQGRFPMGSGDSMASRDSISR